MFDIKTRILVVDYIKMMRKAVMNSLKKLGYEDLSEAADGILAWEALTNVKPFFGLIVSDWNMPNCTGIDILKRVRSDQRYKKLPFVLVTAEAEAEQHQVLEAVQAGVSSYVVKPFTPETFKEKLKLAYEKSIEN